MGNFSSFKAPPQTASPRSRRQMLDEVLVQSKRERIAVCCVTGNRGVPGDFMDILLALIARTGGLLIHEQASGGALARMRNQVVKKALDAGAEWIWNIDDDNLFSADIVERLMRHNVDIVTPLVCRRHPPFFPYLFGPPYPIDPTMPDDELFEQWTKHPPAPDYPRGLYGLVEMSTAGCSGMLVKAKVFHALPSPWFEFGRCEAKDSAGEDVFFALRARKKGFRCFVDYNASMGHLTTACVWPSRAADGSMEPEVRVSAASRKLQWIGKIDSGKRVDYQPTRSDADAVTLAR